MLYLDNLSYEAQNTVFSYNLALSFISNKGYSGLKMNQSDFSKEKTVWHSGLPLSFSFT
jgi:hypothetical protein